MTGLIELILDRKRSFDLRKVLGGTSGQDSWGVHVVPIIALLLL